MYCSTASSLDTVCIMCLDGDTEGEYAGPLESGCDAVGQFFPFLRLDGLLGERCAGGVAGAVNVGAFPASTPSTTVRKLVQNGLRAPVPCMIMAGTTATGEHVKMPVE